MRDRLVARLCPPTPNPPDKGEPFADDAPSDLVNDPSRPACGCDFCTSAASAWAVGPIVHPNAARPGDGRTEAVDA